MTLSTPWLLSISCLAVAGCGRDSTASKDTTPDGGKVVHEDTGAPPRRRCLGPGFETNASEQFVNHVSATVIDENGAPVPNMVAQACGVNLCLNGKTNADGVVVIDATDAKERKPAFKYGDGKTHAKFAMSLGDGSPIDVDLGEQATVSFDPPADGAPLTPGTTASSRNVDLDLPHDMNPAEPDPIDFDTPELKNFRAAFVSASAPPKAVDASLGFGIIVALTPEATELCPAAKLTVPNSAGWPAGSNVEVFVHGVDIAETWAPYGGWAKVSDGVVSADAMSVATADDGGLPTLSVVGIRLTK